MTQPFFAAYINLDRVPARRAFMETQLTTVAIVAERVPAVDRNAADFHPRGTLARVREDVFIETNWDGRRYVAGEEACFQSHILALERFLASNTAFGLIFEDDAELAPDFHEVVMAAIAEAAHWDLVKLEGMRSRGSRPALLISRLTPPYRLVASLSPCSGAAAYLVSRTGAERLVASAAAAARRGIFEPYDNFLSALGRHGLRSLDVAPFPARQAIAESSRADTRSKHRRTPAEALKAWWWHTRADVFGRYLYRTGSQILRFGSRARGITFAAWARPTTSQR